MWELARFLAREKPVFREKDGKQIQAFEAIDFATNIILFSIIYIFQRIPNVFSYN